MRKSFLILAVMIFATSCAFARPHSGMHNNHKHNKPPRMVIKHHPPRPHHGHYYRRHFPCMCHSPYCIHRGFIDTFFNVAPGVSIRVSI